MNPSLIIKKVLLSAPLVLVGLSAAHAQQEYTDYIGNSLLFSGSNLTGTARYQGLGGAQTALGADMGSLGGNPAGLGMYKKSEFSISSALGYAGTSAQYIDNITKDGKLNFNIPNLGVVFSGAKSETTAGKWRGGSFGIGFSRQNSFQNRYTLDGVNNVSSLLDRFAYEANLRGATVNTLRNEYDNGETFSTYDGGATSMYYNAYLVNPFDATGNQAGLENNTYFQFEAEDEPFGTPRSSTRQIKTFNSTGAQSQWNLSYGGNYDDKLYFGAAVNIASLRYNYTSAFEDNFFTASAPRGKVYEGITLNQDFSVRGTGVNLNLGLIFRANDFVRLGVSVMTPTFYKVTETYNSSVDVNPYFIPDLDYDGNQRTDAQGNPLFAYDDQDENFTVRTAPRTFEYNLTTPWRLSGGAAFFIGKSGFISVDADYINYDGIKLGGGDATFKSDFEPGIRNQFQSTYNVRLGGELRHNIFRFRAGAGYQGDPYQERGGNNLDRSRMTFSLGAGVRTSGFYVDLAGTYTQYKTANTPYVLPYDNTRYASALITNDLTNVVLTFGTFF